MEELGGNVTQDQRTIRLVDPAEVEEVRVLMERVAVPKSSALPAPRAELFETKRGNTYKIPFVAYRSPYPATTTTLPSGNPAINLARRAAYSVPCIPCVTKMWEIMTHHVQKPLQ